MLCNNEDFVVCQQIPKINWTTVNSEKSSLVVI